MSLLNKALKMPEDDKKFNFNLQLNDRFVVSAICRCSFYDNPNSLYNGVNHKMLIKVIYFSDEILVCCFNANQRHSSVVWHSLCNLMAEKKKAKVYLQKQIKKRVNSKDFKTFLWTKY